MICRTFFLIFSASLTFSICFHAQHLHVPVFGFTGHVFLCCFCSTSLGYHRRQGKQGLGMLAKTQASPRVETERDKVEKRLPVRFRSQELKDIPPPSHGGEWWEECHASGRALTSQSRLPLAASISVGRVLASERYRPILVR